MKGITSEEFVEDAYYGQDAFMSYHGRLYHFGGYYNGCCCIYVHSYDKAMCDEVDRRIQSKEGYNNDIDADFREELEITSDSNAEIWQRFLNAKIFEGKTILEANDEIEFLYWA